MKTLAQQYQDLFNFIDSAHSLKLSDIANICENATMEFCQNLPSEFDYKVSYSEYDESVEIVSNVKGQSEKTFSVTKGMIARLNTNDCYFAQRLSSYKESLNIEVLSENAQKLRLEKQEVAKEEEQQEVKEDLYSDIALAQELKDILNRIKDNALDIVQLDIDKYYNASKYCFCTLIKYKNTVFFCEQDYSLLDLCRLGVYIERRNQLNKK